MTPTIREFLFAIGSSLAASIIAKVTITTAFGLLAVWLARDNRAAVRHALLAAMFGVMLLLPAASLLTPPLHVGVPAVIENPTTFSPFGIGAGAESSATTAGAGTRVAAVTPSVSKRSVSNLLLGGWAAGFVVFLMPVVAGLWQIRSLRRSGLPWRRGQSIVESLALNAGIHRRVEALLHETMPGPMMCGVVNPAIVLPRDAETWNSEDLSRAIVHELEHVRRGDSASRSLARAICAVYWFHPLVWIAWRKLVLEAERAWGTSNRAATVASRLSAFRPLGRFGAKNAASSGKGTWSAISTERRKTFASTASHAPSPENKEFARGLLSGKVSYFLAQNSWLNLWQTRDCTVVTPRQAGAASPTYPRTQP